MKEDHAVLHSQKTHTGGSSSQLSQVGREEAKQGHMDPSVPASRPRQGAGGGGVYQRHSQMYTPIRSQPPHRGALPDVVQLPVEPQHACT